MTDNKKCTCPDCKGCKNKRIKCWLCGREIRNRYKPCVCQEYFYAPISYTAKRSDDSPIPMWEHDTNDNR